MSPRLIQPGASAALRHPKTGKLIEPLYVRADGSVVWPVLGASDDDPDDPKYTGGGGNDDDDEDDEDEDDEDDEDEKSSKKSTKDRRKSEKDEDEDDEDDESEKSRAARQAKRYRLRLREAEKQRDEIRRELADLKNKDKPTDQRLASELEEVRSTNEQLVEVNRIMQAQLAFFKTNTGVEWADASDAFALAEREGLFDDVIDEDGTVDTRELRRGLRDLAKRKPHLVKKAEKTRGRAADDDDDDAEEDDERPRRSARPSNGKRKGQRETSNRAALAKKFPVLRNLP